MTQVLDEMGENKLRCPGHVLRKEDTKIVRVIKGIYVDYPLRGKITTKKEIMDVIQNYIKWKGVCADDARDRIL